VWKLLMGRPISFVAFGVMMLVSIQSEMGLAATVQKDPLPTFVCQLTIDGLEGNRSELKPGPMFLQSYAVEMPRVSNPVGPLQGFFMTVNLSIPQVSPLFMMAHASAMHFSQATLQCMTTALAAVNQWVLSDVVLSAPKFPIDQISLMATRAEFNDLVTHVKFTWDVKANQGGVLTPAGPLQYVGTPPVKR
jgi:hypothetical protein